MKKKNFLLASTLLVCFSAQYALPVLANVHSDVFNDTQDHTVTLRSKGTGSITNAGTGSTTLSSGIGSHKFKGSLKNVGGGKFTNQTKVTIDDVLENSNGSTFDNQSSITIENSAKFLNSATFNNEGTITNSGIFSNSGRYTGGLTNEENGTFDNTGEFTVSNDATFSNSGTAKSSGTFTVGQNSTVENNGSFENSGILTNNGTFKNNNNSKLTNKKGGKIENNGSISGDLVNDSGVVNNNNKGKVDKVTNENGGIFNNKKGATAKEVQNKNAAVFNNEEGAKITGKVTNDNATFNNKKGATITDEVTNQNGAIFNNEGEINSKVANKDGGIFNNKSTIFNEVENENATFNNEGRLSIGINSKGGTINNANGASLGGAKLSEGTTINNEGSIGKLTSQNSTVNNLQKGTVDSADLQSGSTFNNQGNVKKLKADASNVNNSGTVKDATMENNANLNNNSNGTITGTTNVNSGSTLYNDGTVSNGTITVDSQSTLHLGANSNLDDSYIYIKGGHLDLTNGQFDDVSNKAIVYGGSKVATDLSSATGQTDKLWAMGSVTLEDFNFIPDTLVSKGFFSKEELAKNMGLRNGLNIKEGVSHRALSPLRWLEATSSSDGISFNPTGNSYKDFNPAVMAGAVAAQMGGYLNELNSFDEAFRNMDMYMLMTRKERMALKLRNKYASKNGNYIFDPTGTTHDDNAAWIRPYATFESVRLKNGPKVSNVAYGTYFGAESEMYELKNGWDAMWGAYIGYNGSHQSYDGIGINQNGGTLGLVGMLYKGDFFTGLTINSGANAAKADTMYGDDDFTLLMAGIASKTGYNWELKDGKFIIQPNFMMSYSFVNTFDYTTSSGIKVDPGVLNAITFEPGVKFIGNLKNGWQPYMGVSVIWNVMDKTKFTASDATLPELSVKPFVKYGLGVRKTWGERLTGFIQTYITSGGRNGIGFQAGVSFTFGKSGQPIKQTNNLKPALAKAQIQLNNIKYDGLAK